MTEAVVALAHESGPAQRRWHSVVQSVPATILTIGLDRCIDFINRTEGGLTPADVLGLHYREFLPSHEREKVSLVIERAFETGQADSYEAEARSPDGQPLGMYSCHVGPVLHEGQVESLVIVATNVTEQRRLDAELHLSRAQLRKLTARQQTALEDERRRIARELHDELGQLLTALKIDLGWLQRRLDDEATGQRLAAMNRIVDTTIGTVRRISSSLRPPLLDELGPGAAIDWLLNDVCRRAGLQYELSLALDGHPLPEECSLALFRICQEALTNVVRHARASRVTVNLRREGAWLHLCIEDDGVGISQDQLQGSLGLLGLRERVDHLAGELSITGAEGKGTRVTARFQIPQDP